MNISRFVAQANGRASEQLLGLCRQFLCFVRACRALCYHDRSSCVCSPCGGAEHPQLASSDLPMATMSRRKVTHSTCTKARVCKPNPSGKCSFRPLLRNSPISVGAFGCMTGTACPAALVVIFQRGLSGNLNFNGNLCDTRFASNAAH